MPEHRETIVRFYDAFAHGDLEALMEIFDPQVEFRSAENFIYADQNPYVGRDAVRRLLERIKADWASFLVLPDEIQGAGDMVIARGRYLGVYKATGFRLNAEYVHVFKFREGKISLQHTYTDTAQFRDALRKVDLTETLG
jgi:ketosteroid isomerase-like protein